MDPHSNSNPRNAPVSLDDILDEAFDTIVADFNQTAQVPGLSLVVHRHASPDTLDPNRAGTAYRSYGNCSADKIQPVTPKTRFPICSITKQFISLALLRSLAARGLSADTAVRDVLPQFRLSNEMDGGIVVSFAHLLGHTTGLQTNNGSCFEASALGLSIFEYLSTLPCSHAPGANWSYSNAIFDLSVPAIEALSGQTVEAYLSLIFWEPLEMTQTSFEGEGGAGGDSSQGHYRGDSGANVLPFGHRYGFQSLPSRVDHKGTARLISCAEDMGKWLAYLPTDPLFQEFAKPRADAHDTVRPGISINDPGEQYGLGIYVGTYKGIPYLEHWAAIAGFTGLMTYMPTLRLSMVSLSNSWEGREGGPMIARVIAHRLLGLDTDVVVASMKHERVPRLARELADFPPVQGLDAPTAPELIEGTFSGAGIPNLILKEANHVLVRPQCESLPWLCWLHGEIQPLVSYLGGGKYAGCLEYRQWQMPDEEAIGPGEAKIKYGYPFRFERIVGSDELLMTSLLWGPGFMLHKIAS